MAEGFVTQCWLMEEIHFNLMHEGVITTTIVVQGGLGMVTLVCIAKIIFTINLDIAISTNTSSKCVYGLEIIKNMWNKKMNNMKNGLGMVKFTSKISGM